MAYRMSEWKRNNHLVAFTVWLQFSSRVGNVRAAQMGALNTGVNNKSLVNTLSESIGSKSMNTTQLSTKPCEWI